jgi:hypothetical protein
MSCSASEVVSKVGVLVERNLAVIKLLVVAGAMAALMMADERTGLFNNPTREIILTGEGGV